MTFVMAKCIFVSFFLTSSQTPHSDSKDVLLFEIENFSNPGSADGIKRSSTSTYFIYQSGRIACKSLSHSPHGKEFRGNRSKCFKISQTKIKELTELAGQNDFQTADYQYFWGGRDWGKYFNIKYFSKSGNKEVRLISLFPSQQTESTAQISPSLEKFLTKLGEIDEGLKVTREIPGEK